MRPVHEGRSALLLATDRYMSDVGKPLKAAVSDAHRLAALLTDPQVGGFSACTSLLNQPAQLWRDRVVSFLANRRSSELVLLHFGCHGKKDAAGRLWLATTDTRASALPATGFDVRWFRDRLDECRAMSKLVLLDCCFSGAFHRDGARGGDHADIPERLRGSGCIDLTATDTLQSAHEVDDRTGGRTSAFTSAIIEGLDSGDADLKGDGFIDWQELYTYIRDRLLDQQVPQSPLVLVPAGAGPFVVATSVRGRGVGRKSAHRAERVGPHVGKGPAETSQRLMEWKMRAVKGLQAAFGRNWLNKAVATGAIAVPALLWTAGLAAVVPLSGAWIRKRITDETWGVVERHMARIGAQQQRARACPQCGRRLRPEDRFCSGWGRTLDPRCECGAVRDPAARYCAGCGQESTL